MTTVITYGTFDLFHIGHLNLLKRLKSLGDKLIVGISTDEFNAAKKKHSVISFSDRYEIIRSIRFVDDVIQETCWDQKIPDIRRLGVDIFAMGDDWDGKFDFLKPFAEVVYLPRTQGISSTQIRGSLAGNFMFTSGPKKSTGKLHYFGSANSSA